MAQRLLVYGANGHTGSLVAQRARVAGLDLVVAGRTAARVQPLAAQLGCGWRAASCDDRNALAKMLDDVAVVVNAAGPFELTAVPLALACMVSGTHYLDTSGEAFAYRDVSLLGARAQKHNVALVPGAGFCVAASSWLLQDILASMPSPRMLRIAFCGGPGASVGSVKSLYESLYEGVCVVRDGRIAYVPIGALERNVDFGSLGQQACSALTVADTLTATFDAPSLQQVESYVAGNLLVRAVYEASGRATHVTKTQPWKSFAGQAMARWPATPNSGMPTAAGIVVEAEDPWRTTVRRGLQAASTYDFTAGIAVAMAQAALASGAKPGFHTPMGQFQGSATVKAALASLASPL